MAADRDRTAKSRRKYYASNIRGAHTLKGNERMRTRCNANTSDKDTHQQQRARP
jgi:hypothetical protein